MEQHKKCKTCGTSKPVTEFHFCKSGKYQVRSYCKPCKPPHQPHWKPRSHYKASAESHRKSRLKYKYGISVCDYDKMKTEQNELCLICLMKPIDSLVVDHCHETGKVRGLLCSKCNVGLGMFRDTPNFLINASEYILRTK